MPLLDYVDMYQSNMSHLKSMTMDQVECIVIMERLRMYQWHRKKTADSLLHKIRFQQYNMFERPFHYDKQCSYANVHR